MIMTMTIWEQVLTDEKIYNPETKSSFKVLHQHHNRPSVNRGLGLSLSDATLNPNDYAYACTYIYVSAYAYAYAYAQACTRL